ncbi:MAG: hypothetical protein AB1327_08965 [Bacillota bacterium]
MALSAHLKAVDEAFCDEDSLLHPLEEVLATQRLEWLLYLPEEWRRNVLDVLWDSRGSVVPANHPELADEWKERYAAAEKAQAELEKVLNEAGVENAGHLLDAYETSVGLLDSVWHRAIYRQGLRDGLAVARLVGLLTHKK